MSTLLFAGGAALYDFASCAGSSEDRCTVQLGLDAGLFVVLLSPVAFFFFWYAAGGGKQDAAGLLQGSRAAP